MRYARFASGFILFAISTQLLPQKVSAHVADSQDNQPTLRDTAIMTVDNYEVNVASMALDLKNVHPTAQDLKIISDQLTAVYYGRVIASSPLSTDAQLRTITKEFDVQYWMQFVLHHPELLGTVTAPTQSPNAIANGPMLTIDNAMVELKANSR